MGLFTLWECYIAGIRPLDHLVTVAFIVVLALRSQREINVERAFKMLMLVAAVWLATFRANFIFTDAWRSGSGVVEGSILALAIVSASWRSADIQRFLAALIVVHAVALIIQFSVYHLAGYSINYWSWMGRSLRVETAFGMRPAGFFLEPGAFTLTMFSLLSLYRLTGGINAKIELLGLGTMLLSISLWGWGATLVYMLFFRWRWACTTLPVALGGIVYLALTTARQNIADNMIMWIIIKRIIYPGNDNSTDARYNALLSISDAWQWKLWFGEGINNNYAVYGTNGLSFLLTAGGLVGVILVGILWFTILPYGRKIRGMLSLGFMLSAGTQWTFAWWWVWLAVAASAGLDDAKLAPRRAWLPSRKTAEINP